MVKVKATAKLRKQRLRREGNRNQDKHRVRARRLGLGYDCTVTRIRVLDRDRWTCGICGKPIANILYVAKACDWYGTIDHIVPMSQGGPHTWDNVRAAHNRCNWEAYEAKS